MSSSVPDPAQLCQAFFILSSAYGLIGSAISPFRDTFLSYGPRTIQRVSQPSSQSSQNKGQLESLLRWGSKLKVPHTWFLHFYVVSVLSSLFWAHQLLTHGIAFRA